MPCRLATNLSDRAHRVIAENNFSGIAMMQLTKEDLLTSFHHNYHHNIKYKLPTSCLAMTLCYSLNSRL